MQANEGSENRKRGDRGREAINNEDDVLARRIICQLVKLRDLREALVLAVVAMDANFGRLSFRL